MPSLWFVLRWLHLLAVAFFLGGQMVSRPWSSR